MTEPRYWFPAKRYGWGWGLPRVWQGWAILAAYAFVFLAALVVGRNNPAAWVPVVIVDSFAFIGVCWWKGEPPRRQWGGSRRR